MAIGLLSPINVYATDGSYLYLGGIPAGFTIKTNGSTVIGLNDIITENGVYSPSESCDIRVGDIILTVDGRPVSNVQSISDILNESKGYPLEIVILRKGDKITKFVSPKKDINGKYRLGLFLRDDLNGIGTITYFKPNGEFAALGHPVLDENGERLNVLGGNCYLCSIIGLVKGERGKAGELRGIFIDTDKIGQIIKNENTGLYGKTTEKFNYKNFVIKITDKELLNSTNGILQGMSGSPIVQKGKLIGAVTHVFINDPSRGFGIDIAKMLEN